MVRARATTDAEVRCCNKPNFRVDTEDATDSSDKVFLKRSNASSSFKILIASLMAATSSARVWQRTAHSFFFVAHCDARFAKNDCRSSSSFVVSSMSSAVVTTLTASWPLRFVFVSIADDAAEISSFFAAASSSNPAAAFSSSEIAPFKSLSISSFLSGKQQNPFGDYQSSSGEIVGILKAMKDEMDKDLNGAISDEEKAAAGFEELAAAKK